MAAGAATVHAQKVAYVASEAIVDKLPEAKAARSKLSELQLSWMRDIQRQEADITKLKSDIETNRLLWSAQEKRESDSRLADLESKLSAYRSAKFGPNQEFERQQTEMMGRYSTVLPRPSRMRRRPASTISSSTRVVAAFPSSTPIRPSISHGPC